MSRAEGNFLPSPPPDPYTEFKRLAEVYHQRRALAQPCESQKAPSQAPLRSSEEDLRSAPIADGQRQRSNVDDGLHRCLSNSPYTCKRKDGQPRRKVHGLAAWVPGQKRGRGSEGKPGAGGGENDPVLTGDVIPHLLRGINVSTVRMAYRQRHKEALEEAALQRSRGKATTEINQRPPRDSTGGRTASRPYEKSGEGNIQLRVSSPTGPWAWTFDNLSYQESCEDELGRACLVRDIKRRLRAGETVRLRSWEDEGGRHRNSLENCEAMLKTLYMQVVQCSEDPAIPPSYTTHGPQSPLTSGDDISLSCSRRPSDQEARSLSSSTLNGGRGRTGTAVCMIVKPSRRYCAVSGRQTDFGGDIVPCSTLGGGGDCGGGGEGDKGRGRRGEADVKGGGRPFCQTSFPPISSAGRRRHGGSSARLADTKHGGAWSYLSQVRERGSL